MNAARNGVSVAYICSETGNEMARGGPKGATNGSTLAQNLYWVKKPERNFDRQAASNLVAFVVDETHCMCGELVSID